MNSMKLKFLLTLTLLSLSTQVMAKKNCTNEPKDMWMSEADFKAKVEKDGYKITKFKQPGTCYEIYGTNSKGQKVEIYFNPVTLDIVKSEIED